MKDRHKFAGKVGDATDMMKSGARFATYDSAEHLKGSQMLIYKLMSLKFEKLSEWEKQYISECYGQEPLTRKQHIKISKIYKKYFE